jgi:uncharacterized repeat protein (TIGR01451 family)
MSPVLGAVVALPVVYAAPATAQTPGVPQPPAVVFQENFENHPGTAPLPLLEYTGANGETYTADEPWLTDCNGEIVNFTMTELPSNCAAGPFGMYALRSMAYALGVMQGSANAAGNDALSAYTDTGNNQFVDPGPGLVQFQTKQPVALPAGTSKHYILFSVDAAAVNCSNSAPLLQFNLVSSGSVVPVGDEINACTDPRGMDVTAPNPDPNGSETVQVYTGTYATSQAIAFTGSSLGLQMVNNNGSGWGNDASIDNLEILDATPRLSKAFSPATQVAGLPSQLTFTITNTSDLRAKPGWSFTDALPDGMTVANPAGASTTCQNGSVTASSGGTFVQVGGDLAADEKSCTVTVNVTGKTGKYVNGPDNVMSSGVQPPEDTPIEFVAPNPAITVKKTPSPATASKAGDRITYSFEVKNTGNVALDDVNLADTQLPPAGALESGPSCPQTTLAVGETMTCSATYVLTQADVDHGRVEDSAKVTGTPPAILGLPPATDTATADVSVAPTPELTISKSADPTTVTAAGQQVRYDVSVTNTGNVTVNNLAIDETAFSGTGTPPQITCPVTYLAPGGHTICTATYAVTLADMDAGKVTNTARAVGNAPGGAEVESQPSMATVTATASPSLTMRKTADPTAVTGAGQEVTYSFEVTNTGNVTIHDLGIGETAFSGTGTPPSVSCSPSTLAPGGSTTCTATYEVTQADVDAGKVTNTARAAGKAPSGAEVESAPDSATVTATPAPRLTLVKSASASAPSSFRAGQTFTYRFEVTNAGNVTIHNLAIDETAFSGTGTLSAINCPVTTLAPGAMTTCTATYTLTTADIDAGKVTNTAHATGTSPGGAEVTSPPDSAEVTAEQLPQLALVKRASVAGDVITYTFDVTNTGNVTIHDLAVNETAFSGTGTRPSASCPTTTLAPGTMTTCTATYTATTADIDAGRVTNTATATGTSAGGAEVTSPPDSAAVSLTQTPALSLIKLAPPGPLTTAGEQVTYRFVVANSGNTTITDLAINELAFSGSGTQPIASCPITTLAPGASTVCTATYTVTQADIDAGKVTNTAAAVGKSPTGQPVVSPPSSAQVTAEQVSELALVKSASPSAPSSFRSGQVVTYSFQVTNTGNTTIHDLAIRDTAFSCTGTRPTISCPTTTLAPGASTTCTATYTATVDDIDAGKVTNSAVAVGTSAGGKSVTSPEATAVVPLEQLPALAVQKSASLSGDVVTYRFVVSNTGNTTVHDLAINELVFTGTGTRPTANCPVTTLAPGATTTCTATYTLTIADDDAGHVDNTAVAVGTAPSGSPVVSPPSSASVTVTQAPSLALAKSVSPSAASSFRAGQVVTYSFEVTNTGNTTIHDLAINETAFSGTGSLSAISCPVTTLAPGQHTTCTATYTLTQGDIDAGDVTNTAVAAGKSPSGEQVTSPPAMAAIPLTHAPGLALSKTASPATVTAAGQRVIYSFVVANVGNVTVHDVHISETSFSGTGSLSAISCPVTTLAPGQQTICTATYTVTSADIAAGKVTNAAAATGTLPSGKAVASRPSMATVMVRKVGVSIVSGVPGGGSGANAVEIGSGIGLILMAASAVTGAVVRRRRRGTGLW